MKIFSRQSRRERSLDWVLAKPDQNDSLLDVGCAGFQTILDSKALKDGVDIYGCDIATPSNVPDGFQFSQVDLDAGPLPYEDDTFSVVICSHVIEHIQKPLYIFEEMLRVLKPGGYLFVECPSERSTRMTPWAPSHWNLILSFYDDPTHVGRPWSPQALRRLTLYNQALPLCAKYDFSFVRLVRLPFDWLYGCVFRKPDHLVTSWWRATGWAAYLIAQKPATASGRPTFNYYSFKGLDIGPKFSMKD